MNCIPHSCILCYQNCWALYVLLVANCSPLQRAMYKNIQEYIHVFFWFKNYLQVRASWWGLQSGTFCISSWSRQTAVGGHKYIPIDVLRSKASVAFFDVVWWQLAEYISLALSAMQRDADVKLLLPFLTTVEDEIRTGSLKNRQRIDWRLQKSEHQQS